MSTAIDGPSGVIQGQVIDPPKVISPISMAAHAFFNVLRTIVTDAGVFKDENAVLKAIDAILAYEKQVIPALDRRHVLSEDDPAPMEDVTQRVPPSYPGTRAPAPMPAFQIDYNRLAQAILAAQQGNAESDAAQSELE